MSLLTVISVFFFSHIGGPFSNSLFFFFFFIALVFFTGQLNKYHGVYSIHLPCKYVACRHIYSRNIFNAKLITEKHTLLITGLWKYHVKVPWILPCKNRIISQRASSPWKLRTAWWHHKKTFAPFSFTDVWPFHLTTGKVFSCKFTLQRFSGVTESSLKEHFLSETQLFLI